MALPLARLALIFSCFVGACTTPEVDPNQETLKPNNPPPAKEPTSPKTTWVARDNPELQPATGGYAWKNVVVLGGGFVSGVEFGPSGTPYARTDVGGAYRWDDGANGSADGHWVPLLDWAGRADSNLMGVDSIAPDPTDPNTLYIAAGEYLTSGNGQILSSHDRGTTWTRNPIATPMGGNTDGRSMGERLAVDPNQAQTLFFGSRTAGLWRSADGAATWQQVASFPAIGDVNIGLSLVLFDPRSASPGAASSTIYVGVASTTSSSLYRSTDGGATWNPIPNEPSGLMPHHAALDAKGILYATYGNAPGPNSLSNGAVYKLDTSNDSWTNISPTSPSATSVFGYAGLALDAQHPGTLLVSTLDYWHPDEIFRSTDGGGSWSEIGTGTRDVAGAAYIYWHTNSPINGGTGWTGSIALDPTNPNRAIYGTGQGLWWSDDLNSADAKKPVTWTFQDFGLEETVPLALVSPPSGAPLISGLGDIAGFRHDDLDAPPANGMFDTPIFGNTSSLDFAQSNPDWVVRVGTSSGGGGRGALSKDGGSTWQQFASEPAGSNGQGTIAISADGANLLWVPKKGSNAPAGFVAFNYSSDQGATWHASSGIPAGSRGSAISDRADANAFYALVSGAVYVSSDGGKTFATTGAATLNGAFGLHAASGAGDIWVAANDGLYHSTDSAKTFTKIMATSAASDLGFGKPASDGGYPALYLAGSANADSGIFRSDDAGATWTRIDDSDHQFGSIGHVSGDPRVYGRVYLGTGGRGIIYGDLRAQ
ncbi:MAG TPA: hypothetical protein VGM44_25465 [Polyangiaceae bacterium]|jgi:photosystem II stability/assembly factor-like uncharacterized protein